MKTESITVEVSVGSRKFEGKGEKKVFETREDVITALQSNTWQNDVRDHLNYSLDLQERAKIRGQVLARQDVAGFAAIEKQIKDVMKARSAAGRPVTEDQARKLVEMLTSMDVPA